MYPQQGTFQSIIHEVEQQSCPLPIPLCTHGCMDTRGRQIIQIHLQGALGQHKWNSPISGSKEEGVRERVSAHRIFATDPKISQNTLLHDIWCHITLVAQMVKNLVAMWETSVQSLGWEDPLEQGIASHSSILAWRIPWIEEPSRLQSMESQRVRHDWVTFTFTFFLLDVTLVWGAITN